MHKILVGKTGGNVGVDERAILEWILSKWGGIVWTVFIQIKTGTSGGLW